MVTKARGVGVQASKNGKKVKEDPLAEHFLALERLAGDTTRENNLRFEGTEFIIPEKYDLTTAIKTLVKKQKDEETMVNVTRTFAYRPWDGAYAFYNACLKHFGFVNSKTFQEGSFFSKTKGTQWIDIPVAPGQTKSVPWNQVFVPVVPDFPFNLAQVNDKERGPLFYMGIECPRKFKARVEGLFELVQRELETNSLYRGKAFDGQVMPQFLDLTGVDPDRVVYPDEIMAHLNFNIFSTFEQKERLAQHNIPRKRAILIEGQYGTGKTLAGYLTGQRATANGITFIYCRPEDDLNFVLQTARLYEPACVFGEDLDVVADADPNQPGGGAGSISRMLDAFDGIRAKGTDLMVVLTTNHVGKLHKGMVRPGRLDGIISLGKYDAPAVKRLIEVTVGGALDPNTDWEKVVPTYEDLMPAFIVEAAQRSIRYAIVNRPDDEHPIIAEDDLVYAANSLKPQLQLMEDAPEMSERDRLGAVYSNVTRDVVSDELDKRGL